MFVSRPQPVPEYSAQSTSDVVEVPRAECEAYARDTVAAVGIWLRDEGLTAPQIVDALRHLAEQYPELASACAVEIQKTEGLAPRF